MDMSSSTVLTPWQTQRRDKGEVSRQDPSGINLFPLGGGRYQVDTTMGLVYGAPNYLESKTNAINSIILHYNNVLEQNTRAKHVI
jgi:hypothetical protein